MAGLAPTSKKNDDTKIPDWHEGCPAQLRKDLTYFRNMPIKNFALLVLPPRNNLTYHEIKVVTKEAKAAGAGKDPEKIRAPVITGPMSRIKYPNLHGAGDIGIPGQTLNNASFSVLIYEGNLPDDAVLRFAGYKRDECGDFTPEGLKYLEEVKSGKRISSLEREQKAFFDYLEELNRQIVELMYEDSGIRADERQTAEKTLVSFKQDLKSEASQAHLRKSFFDAANQGGKKPMVRQPNERVTYGRFFAMKKSVSMDLNQKGKGRNNTNNQPQDGPVFKNTGNPKHHIDQLNAMNRQYLPPTIRDVRGKPFALGNNDEPILETNDMGIPSFIPKGFDTTTCYGARAVYCSIQFVRKVKDDEKESGAVDYSDLADEEIDIKPANKKKRSDPETGHEDPSKTKKSFYVSDDEAALIASTN